MSLIRTSIFLCAATVPAYALAFDVAWGGPISAKISYVPAPKADLPDKTSPVRQSPGFSRHALIIGIGHYADPRISVLKGIGHDMDSATRIAMSMGIPQENIRYVRDLDATAARIELEISELNARVRPGDRVFFYFSGHGTRWYDAAIKKDECVEGLMPADSKPITNEKITALFSPIAEKSDKLLMFYDACHSGGVVDKPGMSRALSAAADSITAKFTSAGGAEQCFSPVNIKSRSLGGLVQVAKISPQNVVQISSARPDEVSFDDEHRGGLATETWRDCMLGEAKDADHSGGITVDEITACAQAKLSAYFTSNKQYAASHITVGGNRAFIPAWFSANSPVSGGSHQAGGTPSAAALTAPSNAATAPQRPADIHPSYPHAALRDIYAQRDANRKVMVEVGNPRPRIGKDRIALDVTSEQDGYLYIIMLGSDGKTFSMLFPNGLDSRNFIRAGKRLTIPREHWAISAQGPAGKDRILVVVTESPRDLNMLKAERNGPFLQSLADQTGRANLQWLVGTSGTGAATDCTAGHAVPDRTGAAKCSDSFAAALVEMTEQ
jgi:hypothetical protein